MYKNVILIKECISFSYVHKVWLKNDIKKYRGQPTKFIKQY